MDVLTPFKGQAAQRIDRVETDLVGRMFEACIFPKDASGNFAGNKAVDKIPDCIVRHWPLYNIVGVTASGAALRDEVQPFI